MVFKQVGYHPKGTNIFPMIYEFLEDSTKSVLGACDEMHQKKGEVNQHSLTAFQCFLAVHFVRGDWVRASKSDQHVLSI